MLIVLGVNVFPSAVRDIVSSFYPRMTGEVQILLDEPGPGVKPPLRVLAEHGNGAQDHAMLQKKVEDKIKSVLTVSATVQLVPAGTLPRFEMKGQLIRRLYEE
jgi:phenylacetate-CoA ligase